jgi:NAD(P)H-hydrate epimerase
MSEMAVLTCEQVRRVDQIAIERFGVAGVVLMENAGRGCADLLCQLGCRGPVLVLCGAGNNAGDGFVIARHLAVRGIAAACALAADPTRLCGDAAINFQILDKLGLPWFRADDAAATARLDEALRTAEWIVDALLGTGATGPPRPPFARLIELANQSPARRFAVDLPSGLDGDTGRACEPTFRAAYTATFVAAKPGLLLPTAAPYVGQLHLLDIGLPAAHTLAQLSSRGEAPG